MSRVAVVGVGAIGGAVAAPLATSVVVTHEMLSRTLLGAYADEPPEAMLVRAHPHDRIFRMRGGAIEELRVTAEPK